MFALIDQSGLVVDLAAESFPVTSNFLWVATNGLNPQPAIGWEYANGVFTVPAAPTLPTPTLGQQLQPSDYKMARGLEDLVAALIAGNVIPRASLDTTMLSNINSRRALRGQSAI